LERTATIAAQAEELRSLDAMKSRFFANISHELRTPLTLIMAPIHNVLNRNQLTNRDYTQLLLAKKNAKRLEKMVNQILDLTKLEKGKLELNLSTVVWYNFLRNLIANFESLANSKSIDFQFQYSGNDLLEVEIDQEKVEIILVNLLSNAFKYTPKEGKILLKATNHGQYLEVLISDNGRGILPKDLPNIFNRFYQSNEEAAEGGTGLGLALSKEFVQLMNGTITAESEIGKGASFTVKIPQKEIMSQGKSEELELVINTIQANNDKKPSTAAKIPLIEMENRPTILLVEDNYDLSSFIESLLEHQYQIIKAENGQEAMDLINAQLTANGNENTHQIELIISDLMMPIMDGYQLLEQLKSNPNYTHIPVIMLTARATKDDKLKALRIGVDDYLTKPFVTEELEARIENLLKNATKRTEISNTAAENKQPLHKKEKPVKFEVIPKVIDKKWLERLEKTIQDRLDDVNLVVDDIADEMHLSRRQFYRRIRENTGLTANQYLKTTRLTQARTYLENRKYDSVKAIAYAVGFKDVVYFSRQFKKEFGKLPSEYFID
jgi:DNA-binding response OmpR family regulator/anti-sigma regulatory factor (Ser/Thr protein kinase)